MTKKSALLEQIRDPWLAKLSFPLSALFAIATMITPATAQEFYRIETIAPIEGSSPNWDYITRDSATGYLFLGRRQAGVTVYDPSNHRVVAQIEQSEGANIAALVPEFDRGYTANADGSTTIFELSSLRTLRRVSIGDSADAAYLDPATKQLVFTMGDSRMLAFVQPRNGRVVGRLTMPSQELEGVAFDGEGRLFVAERDINRVAVVDIAHRRLLEEFDITGCEKPTGLAIDRERHRLFVGCKGQHPVLAVLDAESGNVVGLHPIGRGNDGVVYDPSTRRIITTNGVEGNIVVYVQSGSDDYRLEQAVTTRPLARTIAYDPTSGRIYTMTAEGVVDPSRPVNTRAGVFYPNAYFDNTFVLITLALAAAPTPPGGD